MSMLSKAVKKVASNPVKAVATAINPVSAGIEKVTGMDWKQQMMTGAAIGTGGLAYRAMAAPAMGNAGPGGIPYANASVGPSSFGSTSGGFNPWSFAAPVLGAGADIFSARQMAQGQHEANQMSLESAREAMQFSHDEASRQMDFQERMSGTQIQRRQADLKAAGINPLLAGTEGASAPVGAAGSGSSITAGNEAADYRGVVGKGIATAMQLQQMKKDFAQADSAISLNSAAAERERSNALNARVSAMEGKERTRQASAAADIAEAEAGYIRRNPKIFATGQFIHAMSPFASSARDIAAVAK